MIEVEAFDAPDVSLTQAIIRAIGKLAGISSVPSQIYWIWTTSALLTYLSLYKRDQERAAGRSPSGGRISNIQNSIVLFKKCLDSLSHTLILGFVDKVIDHLLVFPKREYKQTPPCIDVLNYYFTLFVDYSLPYMLVQQYFKSMIKSTNEILFNHICDNPALVRPTQGRNLQMNISWVEQWLEQKGKSMLISSDLSKTGITEIKETSKLLQFPVQTPEDVPLVAEHLNPKQLSYLLASWQGDTLIPGIELPSTVIEFYKKKAQECPPRIHLKLEPVTSNPVTIDDCYVSELFTEQLL